MGDSSYTFRTVWQLTASPDDVYKTLERLPDYPLWWPEVKAVHPLGTEAYELVCRATLPYELRFTTTQAVRDPAARVLEATMDGDLSGFSRWTIESHAKGTTATFDEEVVANKSLLRKLEPIARPAFKANHRSMMKHGEQGLRTFLAGYRTQYD
jgi:hypothetical protein